MAYTATNDDLDTFHIIFMIVLFSILLQGSMLPWISRKLDMLDKTADVMKTFNDYSEEADIQFIQLTIPENHLWCGHKLKDAAS
jgi:cell volume regulation protein A